VKAQTGGYRKEGVGALQYWPCNLHAIHNLSDDYLRNANSNKQQLEFAAACSPFFKEVLRREIQGLKV
jgi:hypothetical protein